MNRKTVAVLQARVSSSRLPGKVVQPILGRPMLALQIERVRRCKQIDHLVVATSDRPEDDLLAKLCRSLDMDVFRGSLENTLDRFYQTARHFRADHVVRLTGDCPLADHEIIDDVIRFYFENECDYASNTLDPTLPDGLDVEVFSFSALERAWKEAVLPSHLEHATQFIVTNPSVFRLASYRYVRDLSGLRWTVDEPADLEFVRKVYEALYPSKPAFSMDDVLALLKERPELDAINRHLERNDGLKKSLEEDKQFLKRNQDERMSPIITKCLAFQARAKSRIPGMTQLLSKRPDQFSLNAWPGFFSRAKGVEVWDLDENKYVDMSLGGIGANVLGYADPDVDAAVKEAIDKGTSSSLNCPEEVELAEHLCDIHRWADMARFARTGGEAMTIAVRIARAYTERDKVAFCGYHGWHDWYLAANLGTENALGEHLLSGLSPTGVPKGLAGTAFPFRYNHLDELDLIAGNHGKDLAAIVMEPIRNQKPEPGFLEGVRAVADETGAVLVMDEISAGFRLTSGGAHLVLGKTTPDMAVFSKALGNGYPIAAVIGKGTVMASAQKTFISSTYWTERIGPVAAIATIRKHRNLNAAKHLIALGEKVQQGWQTLAAKHGLTVHVSGIAPMGHFVFDSEHPQEMKAYFVQLMLDQGFLASTLFYAMYAHSEDHVAAYLRAADSAFGEIAHAHAKGDLRRKLRGEPAATGFKRLT